MNFKKGFTLIELLVVITIIGILAVGGIQIYTIQIKKARDSTRIHDLAIIRSGADQYSYDQKVFFKPNGANNSERLESFRNEIRKYVNDIDNLGEKKLGQNVCIDTNGNNLNCEYIYQFKTTDEDSYKLSTTFEAKTNVCENCLSGTDNGFSDDLFEIGKNPDMNNEDSIFVSF